MLAAAASRRQRRQRICVAARLCRYGAYPSRLFRRNEPILPPGHIARGVVQLTHQAQLRPPGDDVAVAVDIGLFIHTSADVLKMPCQAQGRLGGEGPVLPAPCFERPQGQKGSGPLARPRFRSFTPGSAREGPREILIPRAAFPCACKPALRARCGTAPTNSRSSSSTPGGRIDRGFHH
jgi:hypothetical protein